MKQAILKFNFKFKSKDFFVSSKNALAFDLIERWPNWNSQLAFIYGPQKCGKTSISKIWQEKSNAKFLKANSLFDVMSDHISVNKINDQNWIIDDIDSLIENKKTLSSERILNFINILQTSRNSFLLMTAKKPPKFILTKLNDLLSRISASLVIQVEEPDHQLICKIIEKYLKDRNIFIEKRHLDYISNRIERSYKSSLKIAKLIDNISLQSHSKITFSFLKNLINNS